MKAERKKAAYFEVTFTWRDGNGAGENNPSHAAQGAAPALTREYCRVCAESTSLLKLLEVEP